MGPTVAGVETHTVPTNTSRVTDKTVLTLNNPTHTLPETLHVTPKRPVMDKTLLPSLPDTLQFLPVNQLLKKPSVMSDQPPSASKSHPTSNITLVVSLTTQLAVVLVDIASTWLVTPAATGS